jgi:hypothetical protein
VLSVVFAALLHADVLVSAGHEGRPATCTRYPHRACNLGAAGERDWTPIVADEITRVLRTHGVSVLRERADFDGSYAVDMAVFIHFDGASPACTSGASIGYHRASDARAAQLWRALYAGVFPFRFMPDDFTAGLRDYYAFRQVEATDGALVLELGEITCPPQRRWLASRLDDVAALIAYDISRTIGKGDVPLPAKFAGRR